MTKVPEWLLRFKSDTYSQTGGDGVLSKMLEILPAIDVDGNDYYIRRAVSKYRPRLICIESNPSVPTEVDFVQPADPRLNQGSGVRQRVELGKENGYELVCVLP